MSWARSGRFTITCPESLYILQQEELKSGIDKGELDT